MTNKILWEISCDLASVTNETTVLAVINKKVKKLIDFSHAAIGILYDDKNLFTWTLPGGAEVAEAGGVDFFKNAAVHQFHIRDCPKYVLRLNRGVNIVGVTMIALKKRTGATIGCLTLFRESYELLGPGDISVLKDIAKQISIAIENIQLKHDLKRKEVERSFLLSFSYDLATVSSVVGLRNILRQYLKQLLRINEYMITVRNLVDNTYDSLLHDIIADTPNDDGTNGICALAMPIARNMINKVLSSDDPVNFSATPFSGTDRVEDIVGMRLKAAGKDIGILWLGIAKGDNRLLKGVFAQVATVISNVLISREIDRQMEEIRCVKKVLKNQKGELGSDSGENDKLGELIGKGPEMQKIYQTIERVAFCDSTVLILGETGTGKEMIARALHNRSDRRSKRMIKVNCATLPDNLFESELFGHERGSFTGAIDRKIGKFELANNSTLFLDEIAELPPNLQVKLLRAIQEKEIDRIGGSMPIKINVRIVAATNKDLSKEVSEGRFRGDLFYRLNVFPIFVPALRHRLEDVPFLVDHFLQKLAGKTGKKAAQVSANAMDHLMRHNWPGNIRELENCIERTLLFSDQPVIERVELLGFGGPLSRKVEDVTACKTLYDNERDHIIAILKKCSGKIGGRDGAAEILKVNVSTLNSRMRKLGIKRGRFIRQTQYE